MNRPRSFLNEIMRLYHVLPRYKPVKRGGVSITVQSSPAGEPVRIVSERTAFFTGGRPLRATFDVPIRKVTLSDGDGTWMTTHLEELGQLAPHVRALCDQRRVLVGGLGLGVIAHLLDAQGVRVTVVECSRPIVDLVTPFLNPRIDVVVADVFDFLSDVRPGEYDAAYYDIWRSTGEWIWQTQVVPLRRLSAGRVGPVYCWQEEEMFGQVAAGLFRYADIPADFLGPRMATQHYWAWRKGIERIHPTARLDKESVQDIQKVFALEEENRADPRLQRMTRLFLRSVGTKQWETTFGRWWDESMRLAEQEAHERAITA